MNAALRHLLWKDTRVIAPLAVAILAGTLMFHLLMWITMSMFGYQSNVNLAVPLWILMPNLMALGAPPMLVGSEEESGTLGWLRSLPVPWPLVVISKTLVAVAAVLLSWAVSSLLLWLTLTMWDIPLSVTVKSMLLQNDKMLGLAFFTFQLLFVGFFLAYLCRSPILSLILVLPTMIGLMVAMDRVGRLLDVSLDPRGLWWVGRVLIAIAYIAFLLLIPLLPASWRLARRRSRKSTSLPPILALQASQPYAFNSLASVARPGKWRVLLWQAWRQQSRPLIGLSLIAALCITVTVCIQSPYTWSLRIYFSRDFIAGVSSMLLVLACTWIGSLCFYSDSILRRHFFFADRGFPKLYVWCSRLAAPTLALAVVWIGVGVTQGSGVVETYEYRSVQACCVLGFACGLLASMWMARSTLAFFVGPVLLVGILVSVTLVLEPYQQYIAYTAIAALPLLFASWRLTGDWLRHTQSWMTQLRIAEYILLAIVLVPVTFFVVRFGMMPGPLPQWRAKMLAQPIPKAFAETHFDSQPTIAGYLKPWLATHPLPIEVDGRLIDNPHLLWQETHRVLSVLPYDQSGLLNWVQAAQRILQWSKAARLAVLQGKISPIDVLQYADGDELAAMNQMYNLISLDHENPRSLAEAIPDAMGEMASEELRENSWRMALAMEWRLYQSRRRHKVFAGDPVDVGYWFTGLEAVRADRNVDWAVYSLLEPSLPAFSSPRDRTVNRQLYRWQRNPIEFHDGSIVFFKTQIDQILKRWTL